MQCVHSCRCSPFLIHYQSISNPFLIHYQSIIEPILYFIPYTSIIRPNVLSFFAFEPFPLHGNCVKFFLALRARSAPLYICICFFICYFLCYLESFFVFLIVCFILKTAKLISNSVSVPAASMLEPITLLMISPVRFINDF